MKKIIVVGIVVLLLVGGWAFWSKIFLNQDSEVINGTVVPPDPGKAGKKTLAGIDSNDNGIRDDVERFVAEKYGLDELLYSKKLIQVKTIQNILVSSDKEKVDDYILLLKCSDSDIKKDFQELEFLIANTKERLSALGDNLNAITLTPRDGSCDYLKKIQNNIYSI